MCDFNCLQHEASNHGHVEIVELLLDYGAPLNSAGLDNITPLHDAVMNGKLEVVKVLVARGASVTARYYSLRNSRQLVNGCVSGGKAAKMSC